MDLRNIRGVVSSEDMNKPSSPKTERGARGNGRTCIPATGTSAHGTGTPLGRHDGEASRQVPLFQFQRFIKQCSNSVQDLSVYYVLGNMLRSSFAF